MNEKIRKEYNLRKKDSLDHGKRRKKKKKIRLMEIFLGNQSGKQILDEQTELIKYSKLKALANILFEYVIVSFSSVRRISFSRPNLEPSPDERRGLDASDGEVSPS